MKPEKQLYQWDVNQYLTGINPAAQYVDYPIGDEVIRIKSDGTRCRIPDEILQTYGGKTCYERYPDGTYRAYSFTVPYAPKPPDYVYTEEERTTFEALTARVDAAIEDIKRRADSGEFTPKKGVDYFTDAEKAEMMESVSDGAIGEFRNVVDSATTEYNDNHNLKLEAYNQNHTEKVAEYNQNAETKTAEFDANAAALQTEVDRLRGECDQLAEENRKQENRISALMKLNKGQTYDILPEEGETAIRTAPSGAKYVSVDKVGGKSVVFEQRIKPEFISASKTENGIKFTNNGDGTVTVSGTASANVSLLIGGNLSVGSLKNKPFIVTGCPKGGSSNTYYIGVSATSDIFKWDKGDGYYKAEGYEFGYELCIYIMSGAVIDKPIIFKPNLFVINKSVFPSLDVFKQFFPADYYPYSEPTIISSQTDRVDVSSADGTTSKQIPTGFPVLNSACSVYDYIDLNERKLHQMVGVVDLGTLDWTYNIEYKFMLAAVDGKRAGRKNIIMSRYNLSPNELWQQDSDGVYGGNGQNNIIYVKDLNYSDPAAFKVAIKGVMLHYERATPTTEQVTIPEPLQEWLPVEASGTVTFRNSDETKQLAVPNAVSWVRKLDEVN